MDEINNQIQKVNDMAADVGKSSGVELQKLNTIDADALTSAKTFKLPETGTPTSSVKLATTAQSVAQQYRATEQAKMAEKEKAVEASKKDVKGIFSRLAGIRTEKANALEDAGVNDLKAELDGIVSQMEAKDLATRRQTERIIAENPEGMFGQGAKGEIQRLERENAREQADLAIVLMAKNRQYDTAYSIINDKAEAMTEDLKIQLDASKFFYEENKESLTTAEQRQYDLMLQEDERAYTDKKDLVKQIGEIQLEAAKNGAPSSVVSAIGSAGDITGAISAGGSYIGMYEREIRQLQAEKLRTEINANAPLTGEFAGVINGAAGLVAGTKKDITKTNIANALAGQDYATAYAHVANAVEDSLTGSNKTKFADTRTDIGVMTGLRNAIQEYTDAGGDLGYLKGSADKIAKNFGQLKTDPRFASLAIQLEREFQTYRLNMTGAAFSPEESREYAAVNPRGNASLDLNLATIDGALAQMENRVVSTVNARLPEAQKIYDMAQPTQQEAPRTLTPDEAYQEYLNETTGKMPSTSDISGGYKPVTFGNVFNF